MNRFRVKVFWGWLFLFLFFFFSLIIGRMLNEKGYITTMSLKACFVALAGSILCAFIITNLVGYVSIRKKKKNLKSYRSKVEIIVEAVVMWSSWFVVLLGVFPGFFNYDATDEILEVITRQFTTHHPLLHVLYLGGIVQAGYKIFGSYNAGIFIFSLVQLTLFTIGISYAFHKLNCLGMPKNVIRLFVIFFAFFPLFPMFILCSAKDSLFALFVLLLLVEISEWKKTRGKKSFVLGCAYAVLGCLLRNNAIYALIVSGILALCIKKENRKKICFGLAGVVLSTYLISFIFQIGCKAESDEKQEMLTVPIQQLTRVYMMDKSQFDQKSEQLLYQYLPEEYLLKYRPKVSDLVKIGFDNEFYSNHKKEFWKLWFQIGKKSPIAYLNAWGMTSYGYWYPNADIDVYRGNQVFTFTYEDSSYFAYETEYPGTRKSYIKGIDQFYRKLSLENWKEESPILYYLFSPGAILWVWIFSLAFLISIGKAERCLKHSYPIMIVMTLLLGPTFLPRYVFFLWLSIPVLVWELICAVREIG